MIEQAVQLVDPQSIEPNPENPRLIFRQEELDELLKSIQDQGILVPLSVFSSQSTFILLDGERRWRCSMKLGLAKVPVLIQPKPDRLQNIMMMFAIHHSRKEWDPLPTAYKLQDLEKEYISRNGTTPSEAELASLASMTRGEVRRLREILALPAEYRYELREELEKPRSKQVLTVDVVLEATRAAAALRKREVLNDEEEIALSNAIVSKYRSGVVDSTVAPRQIAKIARGVERGEISPEAAKKVAKKLIEVENFTIDEAFKSTAEQVDFEHTLEQVVARLQNSLDEHHRRDYRLGDGLKLALESLDESLHRLLRN